MSTNSKSLAEISRSIGKSSMYLTSIKHSNIELFNYFYELGNGDLGKGAAEYEKRTEEIRAKIEEIYYSLLDNREISKFAKELDYNPIIFNHFLLGIFLNPKRTMRYNSYLKCLKIIEEWDRYNERSEVSE